MSRPNRRRHLDVLASEDPREQQRRAGEVGAEPSFLQQNMCGGAIRTYHQKSEASKVQLEALRVGVDECETGVTYGQR